MNVAQKIPKMDNYTWAYIQKHPKQTKRLLGIDHEQLEQLLEQGKLLHQRKQEEIEQKKIRLIQAGGGNHPKLSEEEQMLLMLVYLRHHLSFQLLGLLFQVSESTAHNLFNYWQNLFQEGFPPSLLEQVKKSPEDREKVREALTEYELIVDSAEQEIERPSAYKTQKEYYSGKQKRHTFKNQFIVLPKGEDIVDVVLGEPGPRSDVTIGRQTLKKFEAQQSFIGDKGYVGEPQIRTPQKKPKNQELTSKQKQDNRKKSSRQIFVEHLLRQVRIFKISQERFRLNRKRYESVLLTVCGLVRLRIGALILEVIRASKVEEVIDVVMSHRFATKLEFES